MSFYIAYAGEVIIKPEYRKDFRHLFNCEYGRIEFPRLNDFLDEYLSSGKELRCWKHKEDGHTTAYDENTGVFRYGVTYEDGEKIGELLYHIIPEIAEEIVFMDNIPDRHFFNDSGEVIIKPEYREDFGHLFWWEYYKIKYKPLRDWADPQPFGMGYFIEVPKWKHHDIKDEWKGRYQTFYDEDTGLFVYGVYFNQASHGYAMWEFFDKVLPELTEKVISSDYWDESMD